MKKWLKTILIFLILVPLFMIGIELININKDYSKNKIDPKYILPITYIVVDKDKTPERVKTDTLYTDYDEDAYILPIFAYEFVEKDKDGNYVATINNANKLLIDGFTSYEFALNDNDGNLIYDIKYDENSRKITIPKSYYNDKLENSPIRMEIVSRVDKKKLENVSANVEIDKLLNKTKISKASAFDTSTSISISKYNKSRKISKSSISVYINDKKIKIKNEDFYFDAKSGIITIPTNILFIKNVYVKINNNIVSKIYNNVITAKAWTEYSSSDTSSMNGWTLDVAPTATEGSSITYDIPYLYIAKPGIYYTVYEGTKNCKETYSGSGIYMACDHGYLTQDQIYEKWPSAADAYFNEANDPYEYYFSDGAPSFSPFVVNLQGTWTFSDGNTITFPSENYWVQLYCAQDSIGAIAPDQLQVTLTILKKEDNYIVIKIVSSAASNQTGSAIYKFTWEDDAPSYIAVEKKFANGESANQDGIQFGLYSDSNCTNPIINEGVPYVSVTSTNLSSPNFPNKSYAWFEVEPNTYYYIKEEINYGEDAPLSPYDWEPEQTCIGPYYVDSSKTDTEDGKNEEEGWRWDNPCVENTQCGTWYFFKSVSYTNRKRKYCFRVKKEDRDTGDTISGISFTIPDLLTVTTDADGIATFSNLDYKDYTLYESSSSDDKYWNDNSDETAISKDKLTEMTYSNGNYTCPAQATEIKKKDSPVYYCLKVKKVDKVTGTALPGARFRAQQNGNVQEVTTGSDGIATFFLGRNGGDYSVTEVEAPIGYQKSDEVKNITATKMTKGTTQAESTYSIEKCEANENSYIYQDSKLFINWYKDTEKSTKASGAEFLVKDNNEQVVHYSGKAVIQDELGVEKNCYIYSNSGSTTYTSDSNGEVCISGIPQGTYTIEETKTADYHTFGTYKTRSVTSSTTFNSKNNDNKFINYPTYFEFTKTASSTPLQNSSAFNNITTEDLKKIEFNVINSSGNIVSFVQTTDSNGNRLYSYSENSIDKPSGSVTSSLYVDDLRKIRIEHLPFGEYSIKEKNTKSCDVSVNNDNCIGYYYPEYSSESDYKFTINNCSNDSATSCTTYGKVSKSLNNEPTEIKFTKKDFYNYEDASDVVDFENDKERNDFDRIDFKIKDSSGNYLTLQEVGTHGTCLTDDSYREYRYVSSSPSESLGTTLHTCGGHIRITNLCRGKQYIVEEVAVPEDSVFVKENTASTRTEVTYTIPCTKGEVTQESSTKLINDKGTRVRFEKRDSKYNYLIPDETTTFEVYRCKKGVECHPTDNKDANGNIMSSEDYKLVKFTNRAILANDEEDTTDAEGLAGVEVYKAISDSDVEKGQSYVTQLHPYKGILVLRYLQSGYNYVLVETVAPKNYTLPEGRNAETRFIVTNETVSVEEVDVPNKPTSILIKKYSNNGNLLTGAEFKVYEGTTCDINLSPINQPKVELKLKTIRDGVYENRPEKDTSVITTCTDREDNKCSDIPLDINTKLTYTDYLGTWADFNQTKTEDSNNIELQQGEALIQYLEYGHCYIIEEIKAPKGYSLPENEEDRFTMVTIEENDSYAHDTGKTLVNTPTPFTFYKLDEFNKLIDGAEFKLQKLDDNKKYNDITVSKEEKDGKLFYKVDENTSNTTITTKDGSATVYYLSQGQYRIIETKAAEGKELTKNPNIVTFFVDEKGNVFGSSIIVNKGKTEKIKIVSTSKAELIVNIQTGQTVIKYGLIIAILLSLITGLMIIKKKTE